MAANKSELDLSVEDTNSKDIEIPELLSAKQKRLKMKFESFIRMCNLIKARLNKIQAYVVGIDVNGEPPVDAVLKHKLVTYQAETKLKQAEFEKSLKKILESLEEITDENERKISDYQDQIGDLTASILGEIELRISTFNELNASVTSEARRPDQRVTCEEVSAVRLPKIELKHFSGNSHDWVAFINLFDTTIHKNESISDVIKFQYLLGILSGEPLDLIKSLPVTGPNYSIAYTTLRERYHSIRRLTSLHLNTILDLHNVTDNSKNMRSFLNQFYENCQALAALDCCITEKNPLLTAILLRKMDVPLRKKFESSRGSNHDIPKVKEITDFLQQECVHTEDAYLHSHCANKSNSHIVPSKSAHNTKVHTPLSPRKFSMLTTESHETLHCFCCNQNGHKIYTCQVFKEKTPQERYKIVKSERRCFSCLGKHEISSCKSKHTCSSCRKKHHSLLHLPSSQARSPMSKDDSLPSTSQGCNAAEQTEAVNFVGVSTQDNSLQPANVSRQPSTVLLCTTLVKITTPEGNSHVLRGLIDSCSQCDFISERAAQLLNCKRYRSISTIDGISEAQTRTKGSTYLTLSTLGGTVISANHEMLILNKITSNLPRIQIARKVVEASKKFVLADPSFYMPGPIDVLIGGSLFPLIFTGERYNLGSEMPFVMGTLFGFVLMGPSPVQPTTLLATHSPQTFTTLLTLNDHNLNASLQRFWQLEEPPIHSKRTEEEELCDNHFASTHSRLENGRYCVRLPFKPNAKALGDSLKTAKSRFQAIENKFKANPRFKSLYVQFMNEYSESGHMTKVNLSSDSLLTENSYVFLPHHGVIKDTSSTTKLRTVFDASSKTSSGLSLNDVLLTGRKLQTDVCDIILNFRRHKVVFTCDIRAMYRNILLHPDDRKFQLILWRSDVHKPLDVYQLNTVTYGMSSSPYLAIKTLRQLADDEGCDFPDAAEILKSHTFMDDIVSGSDSLQECIKLQSNLIQLLQRGCFELRKWTSNSEELLKNIPKEHYEIPTFLNDDDSPHFRILGLKWSPESDSFTYNFSFSLKTITKRTVLSVIAQIYDPCGFLSPITMWAKCFIQHLWIKGVDWDEPLAPELAAKWSSFVNGLENVKGIKIPRQLQLTKSCSMQLHGFSDASESGYAGVVYLRLEVNGNPVVKQLISKTRVAPLKRISLPRLELCGSYILAQLLTYCIEMFSPHYEIKRVYAWCDSTIVLNWLQTPPYRLKTYIANRVSQIQEWIPPHLWSHVNSGDNPADCASRGLLPSQLNTHHLWWNGPEWLSASFNAWPSTTFQATMTDVEEAKSEPVVILAVPHEEWEVLTKFSSWTKLKCVLAYVLRFIYNSRNSEKRTNILSLQELNEAEFKIFSLVQLSTLSEDITQVKENHQCSKKIQRLAPFLDSRGLLRVGGRLKHSNVEFKTKFPIILPKGHHVVHILIDYFHLKYLHAGPQLVQSLLSQTVWIISARSVIRSRIYKCLICFRQKPRNQPPLMGDLPGSRVTPARPFLHTGMDFGGPFQTKIHSLRSARLVKTYICLFICLSTKAVHIEVVTDLTTDSFIAALTRFVSRRGLCSDLYSDCGTNFIGANNELKRTVQTLFKNRSTQENILHFANSHSIKFHFNPPAAPHQGGLWESAIKSAKYHLKRVLGSHILTISEFSTLTVQVEAMLNSRPLTPINNDPSDLTVLTPGHFLIGSALAAIPEPSLLEIPANRLRHWQLVKSLNQVIWRRWHQEYLHTLQQRTKWFKKTQDIKVNDLVIVHGAGSSPLNWPLGRVISTSPGSDGVTRVVTVRTQNGLFTRPTVKVFPLPSQ